MAAIQFAYRNEGLVNYLQARGKAIAGYDFDKARAIEAKIQKDRPSKRDDWL